LVNPIVPLAPPMFSTTIGCCRGMLMPCATARASASLGPPAGKGTISVIGRFSPNPPWR
jgi:hypothetical protein